MLVTNNQLFKNKSPIDSSLVWRRENKNLVIINFYESFFVEKEVYKRSF